MHTIKTTVPLDRIGRFQSFILERAIPVSDSVVANPDSRMELSFSHNSPGGGFYHAPSETFTGLVTWSIAPDGSGISRMDIMLDRGHGRRYEVSVDSSVPLYEVGGELYEQGEVPKDKVKDAIAVAQLTATMPVQDGSYNLSEKEDSFAANMTMAHIIGLLVRIQADKEGTFKPTYPKQPESDRIYSRKTAGSSIRW